MRVINHVKINYSFIKNSVTGTLSSYQIWILFYIYNLYFDLLYKFENIIEIINILLF